MEFRRRRSSGSQRAFLVCASWLALSAFGGSLLAQQAAPVASAEAALPQAPSTTLLTGTVLGVIADTDDAAIPAAKVTLEDVVTKVSRTEVTDASGGYSFSSVSQTVIFALSVALFSADSGLRKNPTQRFRYNSFRYHSNQSKLPLSRVVLFVYSS